MSVLVNVLIDQLVNVLSIRQSTNLSINQSNNQAINTSINRFSILYQPIIQSTNQLNQSRESRPLPRRASNCDPGSYFLQWLPQTSCAASMCRKDSPMASHCPISEQVHLAYKPFCNLQNTCSISLPSNC